MSRIELKVAPTGRRIDMAVREGVAVRSHRESSADEARNGTDSQAANNSRMTPRRAKQAIEALGAFQSKRIVRFAAEDADTQPASDLQSGEIGLYAEDGSTQYQSGDVAGVRHFYIPKRAAIFGTDASSPVTPLGAYDITPLGRNLLLNAGSSVLLALTASGTNNTVWFQCDGVSAYGTQGYSLSDVTWLKGSHTPGSYGVSWNVVVVDAAWVAVKDIIDSDKLVFKTELAGGEDDEFASYNNAFVQNDYRRGNWVLTSDTAGAPTEAAQVRQPDIATGNGTVCLSVQLRTDADPDQLAWAAAKAAADYPSGTVLYASIDGDKSAHLKITTTADAVLVGIGNDEAYVYARARWVETGDIADVVEYGDYFRIGQAVPSKLQIELPVSDVLGIDSKYLRTDGTNWTQAATDQSQGDNERVQLSGDFHVSATNQPRYVQLTEPGDPTPNTIRIRIPATDTQNKADLERLLKPNAWVEVGDYKLDITTNATIATIGTGITFSANYTVLSGIKPSSGTRKVDVVGRDIHRGEMAKQAFAEETPSIAGKGGAVGQVWSYISSAANAAWKTITAALVSVDATGFDGNLETTDNTVQKVVQKVDGLQASVFGQLASVTDVGTSETQLVTLPNWNALPDDSTLAITIQADDDHWKTFTSIFQKSDVTTGYRWFGNYEDYASGARVQLKTANNGLVAARAGPVPTSNKVRLVRLG